MTINIMIPVLNEEKQLEKNIHRILSYCKTINLQGKYQLTIVDNGSTDNTSNIGKKLKKTFPNEIEYIRLEEKGVGIAFRKSIQENTKDIIGYMDLDLATDLSHLSEVLSCFEQGDLIVVGSRLLKNSKVIGRKLIREVTSRGLNLLLKVFLRVQFSDAMCGFKFYKKSIAEQLWKECSKNNGWFYCAEMMIRAEWNNIPIRELPVIWRDDPDSKVKITKVSINYLKEIWKLFWIKRQFVQKKKR